jgi:hypothetical protein
VNLSKIFFIFSFVIILLKPSFVGATLVKGYTDIANSEQAVLQAKEICSNIGFKKESSKFNDCVIKLISRNSKNIKKKNTENIKSNSNSSYVYTDNSTFGTQKKTRAQKKHEKKVSKYIRYPDQELCIGYINNYGIFNKKEHQEARAEVIRKRNLNCNQYRDAAYQEDKRRAENLEKSGKKLFDSTVDSYYGVDSSKKKQTHCRSTNVGGMIQVFCN